MLHGIPAWASDLAWVSEGDEMLPSTIDGINVVLNRARLAAYLSDFGDDKDVRDFLLLDVLANVAGLPLSSTGAPELVPSLALRPFRLWEYVWLFKALGLGNGRAKILDLGGPATHLTILAALAGCSVTSIDVNPEFVRSAQECAEVLGLSSFESRVCDMRDLSDFDDESFDVVVSCSVLEHLTARDQESALEEMSRVLRGNGLIGLTFDYGPPAAGANEYLPPPHDPPRSAAEATRRYVRGGLELVGNPFVEDPISGSLFLHERIRYTVASLFLAKAPVLDLPFPRCEHRGSSLDSLVISRLPSRMHDSVARTMALQNARVPVEAGSGPESSWQQHNGAGHMEALRSEADARERGLHELTAVIAARDTRIAELEQIAEARLSNLNTVHEHMEALRSEADARERGLHELTAVIAARDTRIALLEQIAEERLSNLNTVHEHMGALRGEADARERGLHELAAVIAARDTRIAELEQIAEERLSKLNAVHEHMGALRGEADARERGLHELTAVIAARDARIAELEQIAEARLSNLNSVHEHMEALRGEADARELGLHELAAVIAARDTRIAELEQIAEARLSNLNTVHEQMEAVRGEADARERGLHELTAVIAARDTRIAELEQIAEERLSKLNTVHEHMEALRSESDARERGLHELTAVIAARDARITELQRKAGESEAQMEAMAAEAKSRESDLNEMIAARGARVKELESLAEESLVRISEFQQRLTEAVTLQGVQSAQILALERESLIEYVTRRIRGKPKK